MEHDRHKITPEEKAKILSQEDEFLEQELKAEISEHGDLVGFEVWEE